MTKVLLRNSRAWFGAIALACAPGGFCLGAQSVPNKPAEALYLQLGQVGLDATRVYHVRGGALDRSSVHVTLEDGTIGFTQDVMGRITGAFFEGEGEVLLTPPTEVERRSMSLFTGMAILEERFATAYFRFNDDAMAELKADLRATDDKQEFIERWEATAKNLASGDAMRLLMSFSPLLPLGGAAASGDPGEGEKGEREKSGDRFFHARVQGTKLGVFDVYYDSTTAESVQVGQPRPSEKGEMYYDVWTSFSTNQLAAGGGDVESPPQPQSEKIRGSRIAVRRYTISTNVLPPKEIHARARLQCDVQQGGARALLFELSRFLHVDSVTLDGEPVEFIHNPSIEGTQLSRRGNDVVAVVLPQRARSGQQFELEFAYGGEVLAEAGSGLLYVGARGTWYPNRGMEMTDFDLEFSYPQEWTLVATGKSAEVAPEHATKAAGQQISRWVSERAIPLAGFNLGKYRQATAQAGSVTIETYATRGVERDFPSGRIQVIDPVPSEPPRMLPHIIVPSNPSPMENEVAVGESAAHAIEFFSERFGPFPYSHLALTQMPGRDSQGWPGLIFLSSYAFLNDTQRAELHFDATRVLLQHILPAHETAHQWWGDLVTWNSYRDQWFSEGLAQYSALMLLQEKNPAGFRTIMQQYQRELVNQDKNGQSPEDAGPVTLGTRLLSSRAPEGYDVVGYGRSAWLFHMLRTMMKDAEGAKPPNRGKVDEPFVRALRKLRERYEGKAVSTRELLDVFAEEIPLSLRYEGKKSLDWFLNGWINGTSLPKLELKAVKFAPKGSGVSVSGTVLQKEAPEDLVTSVPVYAVSAGKQLVLLGRVFADGEESSFRLAAPAGTHRIVLDPYETVLTSPK